MVPSNNWTLGTRESVFNFLRRRMQVWKKGDGFQFRNSDDCFGESFDVNGAPLNLAVITIKGRYPAKGHSYNEEAHEMAYVIEGSGKITTSEGQEELLYTGSVVYLKNKEKFAWEGQMTLVMPCSPSFDPEKHKEIE